jgi:hypothetical protein
MSLFGDQGDSDPPNPLNASKTWWARALQRIHAFLFQNDRSRRSEHALSDAKVSLLRI